MTEACSNCRFSLTQRQSHHGYNYLVCRRYPPLPADHNATWTPGYFVAVGNDWWCGEWQAIPVPLNELPPY